MLTRKFDAAYEAIAACHARVLVLRDCFRPDAAERVAVEALLSALEQVDVALSPPGIQKGQPTAGSSSPWV